MNDRDWDGRTPLLHVAAEKDKPDMVRLLTLMGADKDATDNDGWAPLLNAAFFGRTAAALALGCLRGCQCSMPPDERVGGMYGGSTRRLNTGLTSALLMVFNAQPFMSPRITTRPRRSVYSWKLVVPASKHRIPPAQHLFIFLPADSVSML